MTAKERAVLLKNKYSKDYLRDVIKGLLKQEMKQEDKQHWKEVTIELGKLYKQQ